MEEEDNIPSNHLSQSMPEKDDNDMMPLQQTINNINFQEGESKGGMGSESKSREFLPNASKEGNHGNGALEQCLIAKGCEEPSSSGHMTGPVNNNRELVQPSGLALWVKWRGKWQAGIQCFIDDCPSATVKAMPTYGRKTYIVVFFPYSRSHCWTDSQLACAISERPEPLAFGTHEIGREMVTDLSIPRQYMLQKLAVAMLEASDQLHVEAVVEGARNVNVWKEFAKEAAHCTLYTDLGRMLIKLHSMILEIYISPSFLRTSDLWKQQCQDTKTAESTEKLTKDLMDAILWDDVANLWNAPLQTTLGAEWKTWKREAMKLFPISNPSTPSIFERNFDKESREEYMRINDTPDNNNFETSRKRQKLDIRRGNSSEGKDVNGSRFVGPSEVICTSIVPYTRESQLVLCHGDSKSMTEELVVKNQSAAGMQPSSIDLRHRRCSAFIEKKGRNCNRFASEGRIYCVKHFSFSTPENVHRAGHSESSVLNVQTDSNFFICQGMTKYGRRCTHRTRNGTPFCLKHMLHDAFHLDDCDATHSSSTLGSSQKRARSSAEGCSLEKETTSGDPHHANSQNIQSCALFSNLETIHGNISQKLDSESCARQQSQNFSLQERTLGSKVSNRNGNWFRCLGSCRNHGGQCSHRAKQGSAYCEKHLPSSLGHHNIFTASMLNEIFKNTTSEESHCSNTKDLLRELVRSCLSNGGNPAYDLENVQDPEGLLKEVSAEKQRLAKYFGFEERESNAVANSPGISEVQNTVDSVPAVGNAITMQSRTDGVDDSQTIHDFVANEAQKQKCKSCSEEFSDLHALGLHCITVHKKATEWYFRGYSCCSCSSSFTNKKGLERHVKIHHNRVTLEQCMGYFCIPCGNVSHFMDCDQLWKHVLVSHTEELNQAISIKDQVNSLESSKYLNVEQGKQEPVNLSSLMKDRSNDFNSEHKFESNHSSMSTLNEDSVGENRTFVRVSVKRFSCRFCGMKFSLLPDLGRHHQAKHMDCNSGYKSRPKRGKDAFTAKWRANKANLRTIQAARGFKHAAVIAGKKRFKKNDLPRSICVDNRVQLRNQNEIHNGLTESNLLSVLDMLLSEGQKVRPLPNNLEILNVARSVCCRSNLLAILEARYGSLSEKLYVKAARLCSEENIRVEWHREGFICPKGCKLKVDTQASVILNPLPDVCYSPLTIQANHKEIVTKETHTKDTWENLESHLVLNTCDLRSHQRKAIILFKDLSSGKEAVPIPCVVDVDVIGTDCKDQNLNTLRPWESFCYITERLLDSSLGLAARSSQLGCTCTQPKCSPESCDHVYLFENDNENVLDISGKPMNGRFPYDEKGQIILEKGYLVYECNSMCSCQKKCQNRVLQNGLQVKLEVYKTKHKGWGVRAAEAISRGTFVCEYIGEVLNDEEASKRGERYDKDGCSYLYDIDPYIDRNELNEFMEASKPYVIDATYYGNVARFINHSCSPNLVNYQVLVESMDCQLAHIGLYASRDIVIGEELSYNYHYKLLPGEGRTCHCGSENCHGRLF